MEQNHWFAERSKLFAKYANHMPRKADVFELVLDKVDVGWIDMHFKVNGEETLMINASSVYLIFSSCCFFLLSFSTC